jgi:hypothetical protein
MADVFVATTGSDTTGTGSILAPYATVTRAMQNLVAGSTEFLYIRGGTYAEQVFHNDQNYFLYGTQESERITIMAYQSEPVTFNAFGGSGWEFKNTAKYLSLRDIIFDGTNLVQEVDRVVGFWQDNGVEMHHVTIDGCTIRNGADNNLFVQGWANNFTITNNTCYDAGRDEVGGAYHNFYLQGHTHTITGNTVYYTSNRLPDNSVNIRLYTNASDIALGAPSSHDNLIARNFSLRGNIGVNLGAGDDNTAKNNVVISPESSAMLVVSVSTTGGGADANLLYNNTLYSGSGAATGIDLTEGSTSITNTEIQNNIIYNFATDIDTGTASGTVTATNQTTDPSFVNESGTTAADFKIQSGSSAIDAGTTLVSVDIDFDSISRPQGSGYDIGAYELQGVAVGTGLSDGVTIGESASMVIDAPINVVPGSQTVTTAVQTAIPTLEVICAAQNLSSVRLTVTKGTLFGTAQGAAVIS